MNGAKLCFSGMIAFGIAIAIGCGSCGASSVSPAAPGDSGALADTSPADDARPKTGLGDQCNPLSGHLCAQNQTCCFSGLLGTCVERGACGAPFQVSCTTKSDCLSGVCCGSVQLPSGFDASARFDASDFDASDFDASGFDASGFGLTLQCASACPLPGFQLCKSVQDCPSGDRCSGGPAGGGVGGLLACISVDAGNGSVDATPDIESSAPTDAHAE